MFRSQGWFDELGHPEQSRGQRPAPNSQAARPMAKCFYYEVFDLL
jgi:hypothetical protein